MQKPHGQQKKKEAHSLTPWRAARKPPRSIGRWGTRSQGLAGSAGRPGPRRARLPTWGGLRTYARRPAYGQYTVSTRSARGQRTVSTQSAHSQHAFSTRSAQRTVSTLAWAWALTLARTIHTHTHTHTHTKHKAQSTHKARDVRLSTPMQGQQKVGGCLTTTYRMADDA